jgi:hypothetical protein
MTDL